MKRDLYICHTPYQVLVDLCRAMEASDPPDMILSAAVPKAKELAVRLRTLGLLNRVQIFNETACGSAFQHGFLRTLLLQRAAGRRNVEKHYGFSIDPGRYRDVYIHNDWSVLGRYLQDRGIRYILCEDTFASTCAKDENHLIADQRRQPFFWLRRALGYGYLYWGDWRGVKAVECENIAMATVPFVTKLVQRSQKKVFEGLMPLQKKLLCQAFMTEPLPEDVSGAVLFLTRDFVSEGLIDEVTQKRMYRAVARKYCTGGPLFIKAHPRDASDYGALFPDAVVLERTMPSEILNFALPFRFAKAVTVGSTALKSFSAADAKQSLTLSEALALDGVRTGG